MKSTARRRLTGRNSYENRARYMSSSCCIEDASRRMGPGALCPANAADSEALQFLPEAGGPEGAFQQPGDGAISFSGNGSRRRAMAVVLGTDGYRYEVD